VRSTQSTAVRIARIALVLVLMGSPLVSSATPITVIADDMIYEVRNDATYTLDDTIVIRINDAQGIAQRGQIPIPFSDSLQRIDVLEAYTTVDGRRVDVPSARIVLQQLPASTAAPTFSDRKQKVVVFPEVQIGALLTLHYRCTQLKAELSGIFSMREVFSRGVDYQHAEITLRAPAGMQLQVDSSGVTASNVRSTTDGQREWHWALGEAPAVAEESGSVSIDDTSPYVVASTLKSYTDLAAAYQTGATSAAKVSPAIQAQADTIVKGLADKRAQAEAIYSWVSSNIRYVAIVLDAGSYIPHNAEEVLRARYGDCKDHVVLLEALLAAENIHSSAALVSASNSYRLPPIPVLAAFNHVITYLADFGLFVDSTSGLAPFGILSEAVSGKPVLVTNTGSGHSALMASPWINGKTNTITITSKAVINEDGTVLGNNVIHATGNFEVIHRAVVGAIPRQRLAQFATDVLARTGQSGTATLDVGDPRDLSKPFAYGAEFQMPHRVSIPGPGTFATMIGVGSPAGLTAFVTANSAPLRTLDFVCSAGDREELIELTVPPNIRIGGLPRPVSVTSNLGSYRATYMQDGNRIVISRKLDLHPPTGVCRSGDYPKIKALAAAVGQDLQSQIIYQ
jgi:transglutaminase-like putative cysteine protease